MIEHGFQVREPRTEGLVSNASLGESGAPRVKSDDSTLREEGFELVMRERHLPFEFEMTPLRWPHTDDGEAGPAFERRAGDPHLIRCSGKLHTWLHRPA